MEMAAHYKKAYTKHASVQGKLILVGFGSVGQALMTLLFRNIDVHPDQVRIISADEKGESVAHEFGVAYTPCALTEKNYLEVLEPCLLEGDFLLNLSVDVSSLALMDLCWQHGVLYLDTCIEPWSGGYTDRSVPASMRSNYALREKALDFGRAKRGGATALLAHGANPGLVSAFVKQALLNIAADTGVGVKRPAQRNEWAKLAFDLGIKAIHIAERDTQVATQRKRLDEFINTWSVDGFIGESLQPSELGWGTHERHWPADAVRHESGCDAAIYLNRPGALTRVRSWTPLSGPYHGFLITHGESISIADHLTLKDMECGGEVLYRPTVLYAYHPCDDAVLSLHEWAGKNWHVQSGKRILRDEIVEGGDELGVLLMGHPKGPYWYGSRLSIYEARQLAPYNSATSMQVAAGVLAGMVWVLRNPAAGVVEPDDIDHDVILDIAQPYLGEVVGVYADWTPLSDREALFEEDMDRDDPWQFKNVRVA